MIPMCQHYSGHRHCSEWARKLTVCGKKVCMRHRKHYQLAPERATNCMNLTAEGPLAIVRVPWPMPRWRDVVRAAKRLVRAHAQGAKCDLYALDGLLPAPDNTAEWIDDDRKFAERLDRAFDGDATCVPTFKLYDWRDGEFVLVREAQP